MNLLDHLSSVRRNLLGHRVRAALTLLGVVIGTGSIVLLAGLLEGAKEALTRLNQGVNESDTLRIRAEEAPRADREKTTRALDRADGVALGEAASLEGVHVATEVQREGTAARDGREKRVRLVGGLPNALGLYRLAVERGRFITEEDLTRGQRVAVIGHEVWTELLGRDPAVLGQQLTIDGASWTIVGVLAHKPTMGHGTGTWMWDRRVVVPDVAFDATFDPTHRVSSVFLRLSSGDISGSRLEAVGHLADRLLLRRHLGVRNFKLDDRTGRNQEKTILLVIEVLLLGTGLLSLFVGGINIMNIMLVTVTERTREIGIRRALGASPGAILTQFVLESATIALTGGLVGVVAGTALTWAIALGLDKAFGGWSFHVEAWSVGLGLTLAILTGVTFGLFPAWRAGKLDPVEALRYE